MLPSFRTSANDPAPSSGRGAGSADVTQLRNEIERLLIITEALWNILRDKHLIEEEELVRQMVMIDMRDGKLDGKVAATGPRPCPKCNRALFKQRTNCLYCGQIVPPEPFGR